MATFFLLISLIYAGLFYYLSPEVSERSLIIESSIFVLFWIFMFSYFSKGSLKNSEENDEKSSLKINFDAEKIKEIAFNFSYYIWFLLFYISFYLIWSYFWIQISFIILFMNVLIYLLFLATEKGKLGYDLFKVNANLFSIYYILVYILNIINWSLGTLSIIDIINTILIILSFFILIDYKNKSGENDSVIIEYFFIYLFFFIFYYSYSILISGGFIYYLASVSILYGIILYEWMTQIPVFEPNKIVLRFLWVIFSYIWIIVWIISCFLNFNLSLVLIVLIWLAFNYLVHHRLNNFLSLLFTVIWISLLYLNFVNNFFKFWSIEYFSFLFIFSLISVIITYFIKFKHQIDYYTIHITSYFINIFAVILFFVYNDFTLLNIWFILFLDSLYFLMSYFKLNQINS